MNRDYDDVPEDEQDEHEEDEDEGEGRGKLRTTSIKFSMHAATLLRRATEDSKARRIKSLQNRLIRYRLCERAGITGLVLEGGFTTVPLSAPNCSLPSVQELEKETNEVFLEIDETNLADKTHINEIKNKTNAKPPVWEARADDDPMRGNACNRATSAESSATLFCCSAIVFCCSAIVFCCSAIVFCCSAKVFVAPPMSLCFGVAEGCLKTKNEQPHFEGRTKKKRSKKRIQTSTTPSTRT